MFRRRHAAAPPAATNETFRRRFRKTIETHRRYSLRRLAFDISGDFVRSREAFGLFMRVRRVVRRVVRALDDENRPIPELYERGFRKFPGRVIREVTGK